MSTDDEVAADAVGVDPASLLAAMSPEEEAQLREALRQSGTQWIEDLSPDEKERFTKALRSSGPQLLDSLSPDERARFESSWRAMVREDQEASRRARSWRDRLDEVFTSTVRSVHDVITLPAAILFLLTSRRFHPAYRLTWGRRVRLGVTMFRNTRRITTGTSYKAHLAMAAKLFEIPPSVPGVVVECGCWEGGSTTNLSLICDIVGRDLVVYDTFEGLPSAPANDKYAWEEAEGWFRGDLELVQDHVRRFGVIDRCTFRKGLFSDTLPHHTEPIALAFLDVDYASSLHDCVVNLWPHLVDKGYVFIDEYVRLDYCALFFSERWWKEYFDAPAPGMMGVGTGVGVGQYYLGPLRERPAIQNPASVAYTRKDFYGVWDYDPDRPDEVEKLRGH
jgi:O-methyltransferase